MEKPFFFKLILEATVATFTKKLPWIFGSFMTFAALLGSMWNADIANTDSLEALFQVVSQKTPQELFSLFIILFVLFISSTLGKGNLIVSLSFVTHKNNPSNHPTTLHSLWKNFTLTFLVECIAFIFLIAIIGILSVPFLIASGTKPAAMPLLLNFAILTFIPIALVVSFIKECTFLYVLLSPIKIRSAIEASRVLFSRFIARSFFFTLLTLILTGLFTFCVNLVILGITVLSEKISLPLTKEFFSFVISFVFFTWFTLFLQALWIAFFKSIASPKTDPIVEEKEVVVEEGILPEIPPAQ
ncbi:MAG: hypothetical protein WCG73_01410 [Candidatus Moraniibacteriota bacterium]